MSSLHTDVPTRKIANIFWPLLVLIIILSSETAAICSLTFLFPGREIITFVQSWLPFLIAAPMAGLLVGLPCWWRFVILAQSATIKRGILVGCLGSIVAHPVMWTCIEICAILQFTSIVGSNTSSDLGIVFLYSAVSLLYVGWITTIIGGITGILLICLQDALTKEVERPKESE
jgi:hypothetical protein